MNIYEGLKRGCVSPLVEHWQYYLEREGGAFEINCEPGKTVLLLKECPALRHIRQRGATPSPCFCLQTKLMNDAWLEGTLFVIVTESTGDGSCRQTIQNRK